MTKAELIEKIAKDANISKTASFIEWKQIHKSLGF
jgi:hypothetical protein